MPRITTTPLPTLRVMDFDTECRPMHYSDWRPESQMTAYAWKTFDLVFSPNAGLSWAAVLPTSIEGGVLNQDMSNERELLANFLDAYDKADMVVGHYIRKHDLPLVNDHCARMGFVPISERPQKLTQDTKADFVQIKALGLSQDNLAETYELGRDEGGTRKHHMAGANWRVANALDESGRQDAWERVSSDVAQNVELYLELKRRGVMRAPIHWPLSTRKWAR